jgi:hypothetical protein
VAVVVLLHADEFDQRLGVPDLRGRVRHQRSSAMRQRSCQ